MSEEDEATLKIDARFMALEYLMARTYNQVMMVIGVPEEVLSAMEDRDVEQMGLQAIEMADPAMSDHIVGGFQDALHNLLNVAREIRALGRKL
jgi:hypothetical protein